jgi:hypothetical protein
MRGYENRAEAGTAANLSVFMDTAQTVTMADGRVSNACREILLNRKTERKRSGRSKPL